MENELLTSKKLPTKFTAPHKPKMAYVVYGTGKKKMLCFHGYGLTKEQFEPLAALLPNDYTFYCFDLLYHGETDWTESPAPLNHSELLKHIKEVLYTEHLTRFSLMGFSMGAKTALTLTELLPEQIESLYLVAPDGIKTSFWYNLATYGRLGSAMFHTLVHYPAPFFGFAWLLQKLFIMDKGVLKFVSNEMNTLAKRQRVYHSWMAYAQLKPDVQFIQEVCNRHAILVYSVIGTYDAIISARHIEQFTKKIVHSTLVPIRAGHTNLFKHMLEPVHLQKLNLLQP